MTTPTIKIKVFPKPVLKGKLDVRFNQAKGDTGAQGLTGATGASYAATSTTSFLIGTGAGHVFTTQAGLAYVVGSRVRAASNANPANYMEGIVTAYSGTTLTVNVTRVGGSGTLADWNLSLAGDPGSGDLLSTNNLSDLANKSTALTNLANSAGAYKRWAGDGAFKNPAVFDAKDFGVTGNGVTNDTANMQAAFNAANGGILYIGDGVYNLGSDVTWPAKNLQLIMSQTAHFKGAGKFPTFLGNSSIPISGTYFSASPTVDDIHIVNTFAAELWVGNAYAGPGGQAATITTVGPSVASATSYWGMNLNAIVQTGGTGQVIAAEIDVNNYSVTAGLGVGIDLTGEGNSKPWRAIMINRHSATPNWQEGINLANCDLPLHSVVSASGNTIQARLGASFGSASDTQSISFYAAGDTVEFARIAQGLDTTGNKGILSFRTYNGSSLIQSLFLDPDGNAFITGAVCPKEPTVISAGTYTLAATDSSLEVTANCTLTLPSPVTYSGRVLSVKNAGAVSLTSASTNIQPQAGGASVSTILTATSGKWAELRAHSSGVWIIMKSN